MRHATTAEQPEEGQRIDAQQPAAQQRHDDGANADAAPAQHLETVATAVTAVFDIVRFAVAFPFHGLLL